MQNRIIRKKKRLRLPYFKAEAAGQPLPKLRRSIALKLVNDYGVSLAETARRLGISTSGVAQIVRRNRADWLCTLSPLTQKNFEKPQITGLNKKRDSNIIIPYQLEGGP